MFKILKKKRKYHSERTVTGKKMICWQNKIQLVVTQVVKLVKNLDKKKQAQKQPY